jgi:DNA-binding transcriptional LysR family regulator
VRDLVMVDLLELTGSTVATAELLQTSQPTVSRRYRAVARSLNLEHRREAPMGYRYGQAPWVMHLRRGINAHRLAQGVLRVGSAPALAPQLRGAPWVHWIGLGAQQQDQWSALLSLELLDALATTQLPPGSGEAAARWSVIELPPQKACGLHLICRQDPLVLAIAARIQADSSTTQGLLGSETEQGAEDVH